MKHSLRFTLYILIFGIVLTGLLNQIFAQDSSSTKVPSPEPTEQLCNATYTDTSNNITLDGSVHQYCEIYIEGPQDSLVSLTISSNTEANSSSNINLIVDDLGPDNHLTTLYSYNGSEMDNINNLLSYSPKVRITFEQQEEDSDDVQVQIAYTIHPLADLSTTLTNASGIMDSTENPYDAINFQYTWFIKTSGGDNFIYFYIENINLDDANGDFVAIGTGSKVFADSPALMFTGQWTEYPSVLINGTEAYVYLFMKEYSMDYIVDLYYNTSMYVPPTLRPPPTPLPIYILTATIKCDECIMNYTVTVTNLIDTIEKYILKYCKNDNLQLQVTVTEVVESKPCLVIAFYVDLMNKTCIGNFTFTEQAYDYMMGNFSSEIKSDFGQEVFSSCPPDNLIWILGIVVVLIFAFFTVIFVSCYAHDLKIKRHQKLLPDNDGEDDDTNEPNPPNNPRIPYPVIQNNYANAPDPLVADLSSLPRTYKEAYNYHIDDFDEGFITPPYLSEGNVYDNLGFVNDENTLGMTLVYPPVSETRHPRQPTLPLPPIPTQSSDFRERQHTPSIMSNQPQHTPSIIGNQSQRNSFQAATLLYVPDSDRADTSSGNSENDMAMNIYDVTDNFYDKFTNTNEPGDEDEESMTQL